MMEQRFSVGQHVSYHMGKLYPAIVTKVGGNGRCPDVMEHDDGTLCLIYTVDIQFSTGWSNGHVIRGCLLSADGQDSVVGVTAVPESNWREELEAFLEQLAQHDKERGQ